MDYYIEKDNKIVLHNEDKQVLEDTILFMPEYKGLEIKETEKEIILLNNEYVFKEDVEDELTKQRKENFENKFLTTSKGNYRYEPKGYANAQQSIDVIHNMVLADDELTEEVASMVIFYATPDFTKEEECTEEWLVQHQSHIEPMSKEDWVVFYKEFSKLYAQKRYQLELLEQEKAKSNG